MVRIYSLSDLIYEEAYAVGLLEAGLSELRVANRMHLSLETVQQLKQEKIVEQEIQCDHQVEGWWWKFVEYEKSVPLRFRDGMNDFFRIKRFAFCIEERWIEVESVRKCDGVILHFHLAKKFPPR